MYLINKRFENIIFNNHHPSQSEQIQAAKLTSNSFNESIHCSIQTLS